MKNNGRNVSSAIMGRERCGKQMELVLTTRTPPDQLASLDLSTSTKLQIHKHTNTNIKTKFLVTGPTHLCTPLCLDFKRKA